MNVCEEGRYTFDREILKLVVLLEVWGGVGGGGGLGGFGRVRLVGLCRFEFGGGGGGHFGLLE